MTDNTTPPKKPRARVTAKNTAQQTTAAAKPAAPRKPRPATPKAALVEKPVVEDTMVEKLPEVAIPEKPVYAEEEEETVVLKEEDVYTPPTDDDVAADMAEELGVEKHGESDYTIGEEAARITSTHPMDDTQYPLVVWARNPVTLNGLAAQALMRFNNGASHAQDSRILEIADYNSLASDLNMQAVACRKGGKWNNFLPVGKRQLRSSKTSFKVEGLDGDSDRLISLLMKRLDTGQPLLVRLWHSGLVFSLNPFDKAERIKISDRLAAAHLETLRRTNGMIHGTSSYYANRIIVEEFMNHVVASNIDRSLYPNIFKIMDHRDIQIMAWAIMAGSYQRGYRLTEICGGVKDVKDADGNVTLNKNGEVKRTVCTQRTESVIDFHLIVQIDESMFNDWQKEFIAKPIDGSNVATIEDIEKYQRLGRMHEETIINVAEGIDMVIKAPPVDDHIEIGEEWISSVENAVNDVIGADINASEEVKENLIDKQLEATAALDVAHWVKAFIIDGERVSDRRATIRTLRSLSNNETLRVELFDKIRKGMVERLAAVCAIPTTTCKGCGGLSNIINHNGTMFYTPIDMVSRFFTLAARS